MLRGFRPIVLNFPGDEDKEPGDYIFIRFFGNTTINNVAIPNNLAVLLRTRHLGDIDQRTDWNTPGSGESRSIRACSPT